MYSTARYLNSPRKNGFFSWGSSNFNLSTVLYKVRNTCTSFDRKISEYYTNSREKMTEEDIPLVYIHYPGCYGQCLQRAEKRQIHATVRSCLMDPSSSHLRKPPLQSSALAGVEKQKLPIVITPGELREGEEKHRGKH